MAYCFRNSIFKVDKGIINYIIEELIATVRVNCEQLNRPSWFKLMTNVRGGWQSEHGV